MSRTMSSFILLSLLSIIPTLFY